MAENEIKEEMENTYHIVLLEHNLFIVWKPEYNLGVPIIDEQHRGVVTTINSFHYGMQNHYVKEMLLPIIEMIHDYTRIHFKLEEDFLEKCSFPNAEEHHELHRALLVRLNEVGRQSMIDNDPFQFMEFLKQWWINHILHEDINFRNFLLSTAGK
ncbi:MAG: hemerythrin family protein [Oscillospiraceae bacterium]|nr:hemerythrin family protein [Oscillospiraceae bacterium]